MGYRHTWAEINLNNIAYNINSIRKFISPQTQILAVVKADAYGHGIIPVSKKLVFLGINYLGVARLDEAIVLRKAGIKCNILILGGIFPQEAEMLIKYNLSQAIFSKEVADALNSAASKKRKKARVHIKVDTGMGRLGIWHRDAFSFIKEIRKMKSLSIEGIFTHLSCADTDSKFTQGQINTFTDLIGKLETSGIHIPLKHAANSLGLLDFRNSHFNLVRPGIIIYGLYPKENIAIELKPVLSLKTKIVFLKSMPAGRSISYGRTYITKKDTVIATLPIGYGDGYPRALSNKAEVLLRGMKARVVGRVCMDQTMIDVGHLNNVKVSDVVTLIGKAGNNIIRAEDLAALSDTICYEIVCGIGARVSRIYLDN